jgi:hypothetical protein
MHIASVCFKCFICMLQVFHLDVTYVLQWLHTCFSSVLDVCCKCFNCFGCMVQVFHRDVTKVNLILHMLHWDPPTAATCYICWARVYACGSGGGVSGRRRKLSRRKSRRGPHVGACRRGKQSGVAVKKAQQHAYTRAFGCPDAGLTNWGKGDSVGTRLVNQSENGE